MKRLQYKKSPDYEAKVKARGEKIRIAKAKAKALNSKPTPDTKKEELKPANESNITTTLPAVTQVPESSTEKPVKKLAVSTTTEKMNEKKNKG